MHHDWYMMHEYEYGLDVHLYARVFAESSLIVVHRITLSP